MHSAGLDTVSLMTCDGQMVPRQEDLTQLKWGFDSNSSHNEELKQQCYEVMMLRPCMQVGFDHGMPVIAEPEGRQPQLAKCIACRNESG